MTQKDNLPDFPISILGRRLVCENGRFNVYFDHVVDKAGFEVSDFLVVAPKQYTGNLITGVAVLPIVQGKIGLVRVYRPAIRDFSWEIPHGFAETGEADRATAVRELVEETGLVSGKVRSLGYITPDAGVVAGRVHLFLASECTVSRVRKGEIGLREFKLFEPEIFLQMIQDSLIQDTFTLAAWCKYRMNETK